MLMLMLKPSDEKEKKNVPKGSAWTSRDNNDCVFDTWAWQDHRWHNETTNHKSPTKMKTFAFFSMLYSVSGYISLYLVVLSNISASFLGCVCVYPSLVSLCYLFICSIIGCVTICSLSLYMTEHKTWIQTMAHDKYRMTIGRCCRCCCLLSLNHIFFLFLPSRIVVVEILSLRLLCACDTI